MLNKMKRKYNTMQGQPGMLPQKNVFRINNSIISNCLSYFTQEEHFTSLLFVSRDLIIS